MHFQCSTWHSESPLSLKTCVFTHFSPFSLCPVAHPPQHNLPRTPGLTCAPSRVGVGQVYPQHGCQSWAPEGWSDCEQHPLRVLQLFSFAGRLPGLRCGDPAQTGTWRLPAPPGGSFAQATSSELPLLTTTTPPPATDIQTNSLYHPCGKHGDVSARYCALTSCVLWFCSPKGGIPYSCAIFLSGYRKHSSQLKAGLGGGVSGEGDMQGS